MKYILFLTLLISACTPRIYGVSEDSWHLLSQSERAQAIAHYQQMEVLREQRRIENAKIAVEQEKQQLLETEQRQAHINEIYTGYEGAQGDLLRVTISGGQMRLNGKLRSYRPVSFRIADGEKKTITFHNPQKQRYQTTISVEYSDGVLSFDNERERYRHDLAYEPKWRHGQYYKNITLHKHSASRAKNIDIIVEAIPLPRRYR